MNIRMIIKALKRHINEDIMIKYNLGRNKYETYKVKLKELYPHVFTVQDNNFFRCFSYSDIIMKNIKIYLL
jgi:uncharacterized protein Veg